MSRSKALLGLLIVAMAISAPGCVSSRVPSSLMVSSSSMTTASLCGSSNPLPAYKLRIPIREQSCLVGRVVAFHSVRERVPAQPKDVCGAAISGSTRYRLCVIYNGDRLYSTTASVPLPRACLIHGTIPARLLRVPILRSLCNLTKRPVSYKTAGVYVPVVGTGQCNYQTYPTYEVELCVTQDNVTVYAVYRTFGGG
jgi:hypothetical protein